MAQDGGWIQTEPLSGTRTDASLGLLCSGHLQLAADGAIGTGELTGAVSVRPPAKQHQNGAGQVKNTGTDGANRKKSGVTYADNVSNES